MTMTTQVQKYRLIALRAALGLELSGMKGRASAYAIIKREFGLKGSKTKVYEQFDAYCIAQGLEPKPREQRHV